MTGESEYFSSFAKVDEFGEGEDLGTASGAFANGAKDAVFFQSAQKLLC